MKRLIDIIISLIVLILFSPFGIIIILLLRISGEGEVFYKQLRVGKFNKNFNLIKFVTMVKDSPNIGAGDITLKNDPRVLPFGRILRKTKLNEFPQFINVLKGDMSLVGPRPLVLNQFKMIPQNFSKIIVKMQPGITGIGSIIFRNEESYLDNKDKSNEFYSKEIVPYKASLECWYYENKSIKLDLFLIFFTGLIVLFPKKGLPYFLKKNIPLNKNFEL